MPWSNVLMDSQVVNANIERFEIAKSWLDRGSAIFYEHQVGANQAALCAGVTQLGLQLLPCLDVLVNEDGDGAFARAASRDGRADSFSTAGDDNDFFFKLQIHVAPLSNDKIEPHCHQSFFPSCP